MNGELRREVEEGGGANRRDGGGGANRRDGGGGANRREE